MVALAEQRGTDALLHEIQKRERVIQLAKDDPLECQIRNQDRLGPAGRGRRGTKETALEL